MKLTKLFSLFLITILVNCLVIYTEETLNSSTNREVNSNLVSSSEKRKDFRENEDLVKTKSKSKKNIKGKKNREDFRSKRNQNSKLSSSSFSKRSTIPSRSRENKSVSSSINKVSRPLSSSYFTRPVFSSSSSKPSYSSGLSTPSVSSSPRPFTTGLSGWPYTSYYWGWKGAYWWPLFSWRWLRGIHYYPLTYIRSNRENCLDICEIYADTCENYQVKYDRNGNLKCSCVDSSSKFIVDEYCWTPKKCILAKEVGCSTILETILQQKESLDNEEFDSETSK
jgi:hypothetical protein